MSPEYKVAMPLFVPYLSFPMPLPTPFPSPHPTFPSTLPHCSSPTSHPSTYSFLICPSIPLVPTSQLFFLLHCLCHTRGTQIEVHSLWHICQVTVVTNLVPSFHVSHI